MKDGFEIEAFTQNNSKLPWHKSPDGIMCPFLPAAIYLAPSPPTEHDPQTSAAHNLPLATLRLLQRTIKDQLWSSVEES